MINNQICGVRISKMRDMFEPPSRPTARQSSWRQYDLTDDPIAIVHAS
jgi:hypothetical protein